MVAPEHHNDNCALSECDLVIPACVLKCSHFWELPPLTVRALLLLGRENCLRGGVANGDLRMTYDEFDENKVRRGSVSAAIHVLETGGFLIVDRNGNKGNRYTLTWLARRGEPPTNNFLNYNRVDFKEAVISYCSRAVTDPIAA